MIPPRKVGLGSLFNVNEPIPKLKHVRNDGKMGIAFNNRMILPDDFLELVETSKLRALEETSTTPLIEIISEPGEDSNLDSLGIDWEIIEYSE